MIVIFSIYRYLHCTLKWYIASSGECTWPYNTPLREILPEGLAIPSFLSSFLTLCHQEKVTPLTVWCRGEDRVMPLMWCLNHPYFTPNIVRRKWTLYHDAVGSNINRVLLGRGRDLLYPSLTYQFSGSGIKCWVGVFFFQYTPTICQGGDW